VVPILFGTRKSPPLSPGALPAASTARCGRFPRRLLLNLCVFFPPPTVAGELVIFFSFILPPVFSFFFRDYNRRLTLTRLDRKRVKYVLTVTVIPVNPLTLFEGHSLSRMTAPRRHSVFSDHTVQQLSSYLFLGHGPITFSLYFWKPQKSFSPLFPPLSQIVASYSTPSVLDLFFP